MFITTGFRWIHINSARCIGNTFIRPIKSDQLIYSVIIGLYVLIVDRPVIAVAVNALPIKVIRAKPQGNTPPVVRPPSQHATPKPIKDAVVLLGIRLAGYVPPAETGVKFTKRLQPGAGPAPGRSEERRVGKQCTPGSRTWTRD